MKQLKILPISFLLLVGIEKSNIAYSQQTSTDFQRWDLMMIEEAPIWGNLISYYGYSDKSRYWPERKASLQAIIEKYPESRWADDAALCLAGGQASIEGDIDGAIAAIRQIIAQYPDGHSIIAYWDLEKGCVLDESWLMWQGGVVSFNSENSISSSKPYDRDGKISLQEREILTYFAHLQKYPILTKDVAQWIIALMLLEQHDSLRAISELEAIINRSSYLASISAADRKTASDSDGFLIARDAVRNKYPIWRPQYSAYMDLMPLYKYQGDLNKAVNIGLEWASMYSSDGWYWPWNQRVGGICAEADRWKEATEQYQIALQGVKDFTTERISRLELLFEQGYMMKPSDFVSWEHQVLEKEGWNQKIDELGQIVEEAEAKIPF